MIEYTPRDPAMVTPPSSGNYRFFCTEDGNFARMDSDGNVSTLPFSADIPGEYELPTEIAQRKILAGLIDGAVIGPNCRFQGGMFSDLVNMTGTRAPPVEGSGTLRVSAYTAGQYAISTYDTANYVGVQFVRDVSGTAQQIGTIYVTDTAVSYYTTSDQRLKENITDAGDAGALIDSIQVKQFDWKASGEHQRHGLIAQELVTVFPEGVYVPEDEDQMMAVDYSKLVPTLIKEVQSLRARVAALEGVSS